MKPYFIDKTNMLAELFPLVQEGNHFLCITRPRRFGKTVMANMIGAFFPVHTMLGISSVHSILRPLPLTGKT